MPSLPSYAMLCRTLDEVTSALTGAPLPHTRPKVPECAIALSNGGNEAACLGARELVLPLASALRSALEVHAPRRASEPGMPKRCRHDGNTWPCTTFSSIASKLSGLSQTAAMEDAWLPLRRIYHLTRPPRFRADET